MRTAWSSSVSKDWADIRLLTVLPGEGSENLLLTELNGDGTWLSCTIFSNCFTTSASFVELVFDTPLIVRSFSISFKESLLFTILFSLIKVKAFVSISFFSEKFNEGDGECPSEDIFVFELASFLGEICLSDCFDGDPLLRVGLDLDRVDFCRMSHRGRVSISLKIDLYCTLFCRLGALDPTSSFACWTIWFDLFSAYAFTTPLGTWPLLVWISVVLVEPV